MRYLLIVAALCLTGCSNSADYYRAHPKERDERVKECAIDNGGVLYEQDCLNARQAMFEALDIPAKDGVAVVR